MQDALCVQHELDFVQVLKYGIGTAAVLRLVMILLGSELIDSWKPVLLLFAGILLFSSYKLLASGESDDADDEDLSDNGIVKLCRWACGLHSCLLLWQHCILIFVRFCKSGRLDPHPHHCKTHARQGRAPDGRQG